MPKPKQNLPGKKTKKTANAAKPGASKGLRKSTPSSKPTTKPSVVVDLTKSFKGLPKRVAVGVTNHITLKSICAIDQLQLKALFSILQSLDLDCITIQGSLGSTTLQQLLELIVTTCPNLTKLHICKSFTSKENGLDMSVVVKYLLANKDIECLDLSGNYLSSWPEDFPKLESLTILNICDTEWVGGVEMFALVENTPKLVQFLADRSSFLHNLMIREPKKVVPPNGDAEYWRDMEMLSLSDCKYSMAQQKYTLIEFSKIIGFCAGLVTLDVSGVEFIFETILKCLEDAELRDWEVLEMVDFSRCSFLHEEQYICSTLFGMIDNLWSLEQLNLSDTATERLPPRYRRLHKSQDTLREMLKEDLFGMRPWWGNNPPSAARHPKSKKKKKKYVRKVWVRMCDL